MNSPIRLAALLILACSVTCLAGSFDEEFALSVKAGTGQLTAEEKKALLKDNHPILMQIGDKA